tara:strand:- start:2314 stop:3252 length:939 start_codon:yes stop_codon:yes gene_type:complete
MNKKTLITGGAGFIGYHLCLRLLKLGYEVLCIDNLYSGSYENVKILSKYKNFRFLNLDICNPIRIKYKPNEIYHLACPASPKAYQFDPIKTLNTCSKGSINILEFAKKNNSKILLSSTSEIYGDPLQHPQTESYFGNVNPIGPRSCYDEGKRYAESLFINYHNYYKINIKISRIFNVYGPNMDRNDGRVVSNFITQCLDSKPITINGSGAQTRSFCYVSDLVDGLIKLMKSKNLFIGPVNIGNPNEISIYKMAKKIKKLTKSESEIIFMETVVDDPLIRKPNIKLAKKELNWTPKVKLDDGIRKTIDYFRNL